MPTSTSLLSRCSRAFAALLVLVAGAAAAAPAPAPAPAPRPARLHWVPADNGLVTLDAASRLLLARSAAEHARLQEVGLDFRDVYGVIHAETSWVPRAGIGKNGVVSEGLAQFEPATAHAVGLRDPNDATQAVLAAGRLLREAAVWSAQRIARLGLPADERAVRLREGISIYYNLSSRARNAWSGLNTETLPVETRRHIRNVRAGAREADRLDARLGGPALPPLPAVEVAAAKPERAATTPHGAAVRAARPVTVGTIEWSGERGAGAADRRTYVVMSNGSVRAHTGAELPPGAIQWTRRG